jgi:hypothetical protein
MISEDGSEHKSENCGSYCEYRETRNRRKRREIEQKLAKAAKDLENVDARLGAIERGQARAGQVCCEVEYHESRDSPAQSLFAIFATFCSIPLQNSVISTTNLPVVFLDSRSRWAWATSGKG